MDALSLSFLRLSAGQVAGIAAVGAAVAIALFLLRPRPPRVEVSSHVLWDQVLPKRRNPLVREAVMLALQILAIAALAIALGEPEREEAPAVGSEAVPGGGAPLDRLWVVDTSLSMDAVDAAGVSRIEAVREALTARLDELPSTVRVGLVGAGPSAELLAPLSDDRSRTRLALRMLEASGVGADLPGALAAAAAQRDPGRPTGLELFTDDPGAAETLRAFSEAEGIAARLRAPFSPAPNVAITAFDLRGSAGLPAEEEALVAVRNLAPYDAELRLTLETSDSLLGEAELRVPAGGEALRRYRFRPLPAAGVEAVLRDVRFPDAPGAASDGFAHDDRAFAWIEPVRPVRVLLVSEGNRYLERVLALLPGAELGFVRPGEYGRKGAALAAEADLVFFDGWAPAAPPPRAFFVAGPDGAGPFGPAGRVDAPAVTDWNYEHPLFRGVVLRDLQVQRATVLRAEEGDERLLGSPSGPLALARQDGERRWVGWGFDFADSDLPLRLAFPQTIVNALLWTREGRAVGDPPGGRARLASPSWLGPELAGEARRVVVTDLRQEAWARGQGDERAAQRAGRELAVGDGGQPRPFPRPGLYRVAGEAGSRELAVNLFDLDESRTWELPEGDDAVVPLPPADGEPAPTRAPLWLAVALVAGAAAFVEFGLYTR